MEETLRQVCAVIAVPLLILLIKVLGWFKDRIGNMIVKANWTKRDLDGTTRRETEEALQRLNGTFRDQEDYGFDIKNNHIKFK